MEAPEVTELTELTEGEIWCSLVITPRVNNSRSDEVLVFIGFIIKVNTPTAKVFQSKTSTSVTISRICPGAHSEKEVAGHQLNDATTLI